MAHRILIPFELPDAEPLSPVLVEDLASLDIVVLGHYGLPEQTPMEAARNQFGEAAQAELDGLAEPFREAGASVQTRLVFGKDRTSTIDRIAVEEDCHAELDPAPTEEITRILVPLRDTTNLDRLADFVFTLLEETTNEITLFHVAEGSEEVSDAESMLLEARNRMIQQGFDPKLVDVSTVDAEDHDEEILRMAEEYDAVVMDEAESTIQEHIFGTLPDKIADRTGDPVIVVNREH